MAPSYKLIYFVSRGVAEPLRFLLKYGQIEFEDVRIEREEWPQLKDKTPFGQLPLLEHDDKQFGQSVAIARYLGRQVKLAGNDDWEDLEIDAIVETIQDVVLKTVAAFMELDETKQKSLVKTLAEETIPFYYSRLEAIVEKNNGFLAVGRMTWADFYFAHICTFFDYVTQTKNLEKYSNLKGVQEKVYNLPAIKEWLKIRPDIEFLNLAR